MPGKKQKRIQAKKARDVGKKEKPTADELILKAGTKLMLTGIEGSMRRFAFNGPLLDRLPGLLQPLREESTKPMLGCLSARCRI